MDAKRILATLILAAVAAALVIAAVTANEPGANCSMSPRS
jgi:hypothetical protein